MKKLFNKNALFIIGIILFSCAVMYINDSIISPPFYIKPLVKIPVFVIIPIILLSRGKNIDVRGMFTLSKKNFVISLLLGLGVFAFIMTAYAIFKNVFDFSMVTASLAEIGVTKNNFLFVCLYVAFINSLVEEFFFRGIAFLTLEKHMNGIFAFVFSAVCFSLYHVAVIDGWFDLPVYILLIFSLVVAGFIFNSINRKTQSIVTSWFVHMFANFAINLVGFFLLTAD